MTTDTIVAIASAPGRAGIGIVRVSGPLVPAIAEALIGTLPEPRMARARAFRGAEDETLDLGIALYFEAPHSYTGEAVLELHGHGAPWALNAVLERAVALGARRARPGEFSERAFLNGRLDLAQAEAIADLIDAGSEQAARAALRSLTGEFSRRVEALLEGLIGVRTEVEAGIDFSDEAIELKGAQALAERTQALMEGCARLAQAAEQGRLLRDGLVVVLAGRPNAGKSSLLNRLVGEDAAIVTPIPGTTRDLLKAGIVVAGLPIELVDTAGLSERPEPIEAEGIRRARVAMAAADRILYVVDAADPAARVAYAAEVAALPHGVAVTVLLNKGDRLSAFALTVAEEEARVTAPPPRLVVSAATGAGLEALRVHLARAAGYAPAGGTFSARRRHLEAIARTREHLMRAREELANETRLELAAEELRLAQQALSEVTGQFTSEDLLDRIFSTFCIGK